MSRFFSSSRWLPSLLATLCLTFAAASHAQQQQTLKVTAIPDESPTELARKAAPLVKYLEEKLGMTRSSSRP